MMLRQLNATSEESWRYSPNPVLPDDWSLAGHLPIKHFRFDGEIIWLHPVLEFFLVENEQDDALEMWGEAPYASVFVSAPDIASAIEELRTDVLPFLWQEYALENDAALSREARELKADLLRRAGR